MKYVKMDNVNFLLSHQVKTVNILAIAKDQAVPVSKSRYSSSRSGNSRYHPEKMFNVKHNLMKIIDKVFDEITETPSIVHDKLSQT